ncbi:hypothetical protein K7432_017474 [Basidiobolus ranarum]|uniref:Uncharacterized protein n=1 Tax=Basidiobolus ranarum TaxID=34480 RepID=A0ABR2WDB1_9FUNG
MSDTPLKRTTRRTTSVRRTVQTTSGSISTTGPTRNTSVNIATAFKLSGLSEPTSDTDSPSRKPRDSDVNTSAPIRDLEGTDTEEELSDIRTDTESDEEEPPNNTRSTGLGRRFLSSILPHSPQWIRATTPQHDESTGNETESESDQDDGTPTEVLHTKNTDSTRLNRISEAPSTVNLVAGRYYLRPRPNSPARSVGRAPGQLHEHLATSSDDDEWSPKFTFNKSTHLSNHNTNQKIVENLQEDSEESSSDESSFSGSDSEEEYPEVVKIPIWHPIQTLIVGCFAGVGQVVKGIFSAIGFLIFMVAWVFKEIAILKNMLILELEVLKTFLGRLLRISVWF